MATAESVKAKLQGLIDKANDTTGGADADLTNAVDRLCDGYGSGGGVEVVAQSKTVTPTKARQTVLPDTGYTHLSKVTVNAIPDKYIEPSGSLKITANGTYDVARLARVNVAVESGGEKLYLHTITFTNDDGGEHTLTMTLVNNSSVSLSGEYEFEDTDIYNGAIIEGYESNGAVVGHYSNGGGGSCYLELEDGTQVNSFYGYYYDTVTEHGGGESDPAGDVYEGSYEITPKIESQILPTAQKVMEQDLTIKKIPFFEVSNNTGGTTVTIGIEV